MEKIGPFKVRIYRSGERYLLKLPSEFEPLLKNKKHAKIILIIDD